MDLGLILGGSWGVVTISMCERKTTKRYWEAQIKLKQNCWHSMYYTSASVHFLSRFVVDWRYGTRFCPLDVERITPCAFPALSFSAMVIMRTSHSWWCVTRRRRSASETGDIVWTRNKHLIKLLRFQSLLKLYHSLIYPDKYPPLFYQRILGIWGVLKYFLNLGKKIVLKHCPKQIWGEGRQRVFSFNFTGETVCKMK